MRDATLCFLVRGNPAREVLLGFKKTGFGAGKYNGFGGKVELGERIPQAAIRELAEECGIVVAETALRHRADLSFSFPYRPDWNQRVFVFVAVTWSGIAVESREMRPEWFAVDQIPYHQMWQDDRYWLPRVLAKRPLAAHFVFAEDNETIAEMTLHDLATS